jgi:hypothetical protein
LQTEIVIYLLLTGFFSTFTYMQKRILKNLWLVFMVSSLAYSSFSFGQVNLVPNPGFEIYDSCPNGPGQIDFLQNWFNPTPASPDFFDSCFTFSNPWLGQTDVPQNDCGNQNALAGGGYAGLIGYYDSSFIYREYIEIKLSSTLQTNQKYFVSFYVNLSDSSREAIDQMGCYFSNDTIKRQDNLPFNYTPHIFNPDWNYLNDKQNWAKISGTYTAVGNENFLTIGNFKNTAATNVIYAPNGSSFSGWSCAYYYIDEVCVSADSLLCNSLVSINEGSNILPRIFPNPVNEYLTIVSKEKSFVVIYDLLGNVIFQEQLNIGNNSLSTITLGNAIYFVEIVCNSHRIFREKIIVQH